MLFKPYFPLLLSMSLAIGLVLIGEQRTACMHYYEPVCYIPHPRGPYCGDRKSEKRGYTYEIYNWYFVFALLVLGFAVLV
jgi:hypothetical protein